MASSWKTPSSHQGGAKEEGRGRTAKGGERSLQQFGQLIHSGRIIEAPPSKKYKKIKKIRALYVGSLGMRTLATQGPREVGKVLKDCSLFEGAQNIIGGIERRKGWRFDPFTIRVKEERGARKEDQRGRSSPGLSTTRSGQSIDSTDLSQLVTGRS